LLPRSFFERDPVTVSRELLGKIIVRRTPSARRGGAGRGRSGTLIAGRIVETEAYLGAEDPAAHAYSGPTERNRVLFGPPGHAYVYFIYGMYYCLNFSCMKTGKAGCTLIRALEPIEGAEEMLRNRGLHAGRTASRSGEITAAMLRKVANGPGKLCAALAITRAHDNGKDVCSAASDLQVVDDAWRPAAVGASGRVGITKAVHLPLRFFIEGSAFLSRPALEKKR
jgi:DNA-3-methyladenine glycosylase